MRALEELLEESLMSCHFAPPREACKAPLSIVSLRTSWRGAGGEVCAGESNLRHLRGQERGVLSLRAAETRREAEVCAIKKGRSKPSLAPHTRTTLG